MGKILVVGAGFAGAVAARTLAEAGHQVLVIDKRNHIAGNAYDEVNEHGIRVHKYGPHIWHTSNKEAHEWFSRFTEWVEYKHFVYAQLKDGSHVPLPVNADTIKHVLKDELKEFVENYDFSAKPEFCGLSHQMPEFLQEFLDSISVKLDDLPKNSREVVESSVGKKLTELFFAPYTKKMWGMDLSDLPAGVAARIPTRTTDENLYFPNDTYQAMPKEGYTKAFERIFDHPNITVWLSTSREDVFKVWNAGYHKFSDKRWDGKFEAIFTSEPIDALYDSDLGELPWRSIKFHTVTLPLPTALPSPVVNFTHDGKHTRVTEWKKFPSHGDNDYSTTLTFEEPCDYKDNNFERYYPVKSSSEIDPNRELYKKYRERAEKDGFIMIGRMGNFVYLDMHQVISSTLATVKKFLNR